MPKAAAFFGWRVAAAASGVQFLMWGLMLHAFGAYVAVWHETEGWSKTALSGVAAMQQMEAALLGPLQGWIIDRYGSRGMVRAGIVLFSLGLMGLSTAGSLGGFYAWYVLIALGIGLTGILPLSGAVINWFERQRSRALALLMLGMVVGGFAAPGVAWALQSFGWRPVALTTGVIVLLAGLPMAGALHRRPEDFGQHVDGIAPPGEAAADAKAPSTAAPAPHSTPLSAPSDSGSTLREALCSRAFWLLALTHAFAMLAVATFNVHAVTHVKEGLGFSVAQAATVLSVQTAAYAGGVFVCGVVGDRWSKRLLIGLCMLLHGAGLALLAHAATTAVLMAAALAHGFAWGLRGTLINAIRADYFGRNAFGMIVGLSMLVVLLGQVGGPMLAGMTADATGDYKLGFTILAVLAALGSIFVLLLPAPPGAQRSRPQRAAVA